MAGFPEPEVGLVISYSYLWKEEEERGLVEERKERPCAIVVAIDLHTPELGGRKQVAVAPITHSGRRDGGARCGREPHDDHALGAAVRARVRATLGTILQANRFVVADGRNRGIRSRTMALPVSGCRPKREVSALAALRGRTVDSAQEFFRQAVKVAGSEWPEKINLDGNAASRRGLRQLGEEDSRWDSVNVRARRYLNNIVEQDHRAIKRRYAPMLGLKSFATAAVTLSGLELAHRIRKRQFTIPYECNGETLSLKELWDQAISGKSMSGGLEITQRPLTHQIRAVPTSVGFQPVTR